MYASPSALRLLAASLALAIFAADASAQVVNPERPTFLRDSAYADADHAAALYAPPAAGRSATLAKVDAAATLLRRSRDGALRAAAADTLVAALRRGLASEWGRAYDWRAVRGISAQRDSAAGWWLLTAQHFVDDSTYRYRGLLYDGARGGRITELRDSAQALGAERDYELDPDAWYGALYYGVRAFTLASGKPAWLLFGYDADGYYHRRKVADVLTFDRRGRPRFGKEVFVGSERDSTGRAARLVLEYRVDARVGLRYDEALGGIVFDRLVTGPPVRRGGPPSRIPDGSYDGYVLDAATGTWRYRMEWFDRVVSPEPPMTPAARAAQEAPVSRDLFGRARPPRRRGR